MARLEGLSPGSPRGRLGRRALRTLWRSFPPSAQLKLVAAVFVTFAPIGLLQDLLSLHEPWPLGVRVARVMFAGFVAVGYFLSSVTTLWLLVVVAPLHVLLPDLLVRHPFVLDVTLPAGSFALDPTSVVPRVLQDAVGMLLCTILGYSLMTRFLRREGAERLRLGTEIALARRIHETLVPPVNLATTRLEVYGRSDPSSEVGGDLLDAVERNDAIVLLVADVAGHGVSAGTLMASVKSAIRTRLLAGRQLAPLLEDLNHVLRELASPERFVTLAALAFEPSGLVVAALAGHLPILHLRRDGGVERIDNDHPPLGVLAAPGYAARRVPAAPGDLLAILTDGLTEVTDARGTAFGIEGVERELLARAGEPLAAIHAGVFAAVGRHGVQADDQTLLLARIR